MEAVSPLFHKRPCGRSTERAAAMGQRGGISHAQKRGTQRHNPQLAARALAQTVNPAAKRNGGTLAKNAERGKTM
jgi:hypothetical protein